MTDQDRRGRLDAVRSPCRAAAYLSIAMQRTPLRGAAEPDRQDARRARRMFGRLIHALRRWKASGGWGRRPRAEAPRAAAAESGAGAVPVAQQPRRLYRSHPTSAIRPFIALSEARLEVLARAVYDPDAERSYEGLSESFLWSDERLWEAMAHDKAGAVRRLMGYRGSVIRGAPDSDLRPLWEQVVRTCPNWPGVRPERSSPALSPALNRARRKFCVVALRVAREREGEDSDE
jgi:hypothetical protein